METKINTKKGAIELSIGTVVIIVLAMGMLILGGILIKTIFTSAQEAVYGIDAGVKNKIQDLFRADDSRPLVLIPDNKIIKLKQGETEGGFALSIRNTESGGGTDTFSYDITLATTSANLQENCDTTDSPLASGGWARITNGKSLQNLALARGNSMPDPVHVRFAVSNTAPICTFRVQVDVLKNGGAYATSWMDITIKPK